MVMTIHCYLTCLDRTLFFKVFFQTLKCQVNFTTKIILVWQLFVYELLKMHKHNKIVTENEI